ncbi:MAG: sigma-70 family RNA polymerase sigma factor [Nocardioides sp.]
MSAPYPGAVGGANWRSITTRLTRQAVQEQPSEPDDETWLRGLYADHGAALLAYATRLTGDRQAAEDIVQEALVRAWRRRPDRESEAGSLRGWLFTVTRNLAFDRGRARKARPVEVAMPEHDTARLAAADETDRVVTSVVVHDALAALSPAHREVLELVYLGGRTTAEAGQALGVPPGTVKSRVHYALRAMKVALDERGDTDAAPTPQRRRPTREPEVGR